MTSDAETKAQAQNAVDPEGRREDKKLTAEELASIAGGEEGGTQPPPPPPPDSTPTVTITVQTS